MTDQRAKLKSQVSSDQVNLKAKKEKKMMCKYHQTQQVIAVCIDVNCDFKIKYACLDCISDKKANNNHRCHNVINVESFEKEFEEKLKEISDLVSQKNTQNTFKSKQNNFFKQVLNDFRQMIEKIQSQMLEYWDKLNIKDFCDQYRYRQLAFLSENEQNLDQAIAILNNLDSKQYVEDSFNRIELFQTSALNIVEAYTSTITPSLETILTETSNLFQSKGFDWDRVKRVSSVQAHENRISQLLRLNVNEVATFSFDKEIKIWDLNTLQEVALLKGHQSQIRGGTKLDQFRIVTVDWDAVIKLWNLNTGTCIQTIMEHQVGINCVPLFMKNHQWLFTGGEDCKLIVWTYHKTLKRKKAYDIKQKVTCLQDLSPESIAVGCGNGRMFFIQVLIDSVLEVEQFHKKSIYSMAMIGGSRLASGGLDFNIAIWNVHTKTLHTSIQNMHFGNINQILLFTQEQFITISDDQHLRVFNEQGEQKMKLHVGLEITSICKVFQKLFVTGSTGEILVYQ